MITIVYRDLVIPHTDRPGDLSLDIAHKFTVIIFGYVHYHVGFITVVGWLWTFDYFCAMSSTRSKATGRCWACDAEVFLDHEIIDQDDFKDENKAFS